VFLLPQKPHSCGFIIVLDGQRFDPSSVFKKETKNIFYLLVGFMHIQGVLPINTSNEK
jgi:hypothetical protein